MDSPTCTGGEEKGSGPVTADSQPSDLSINGHVPERQISFPGTRITKNPGDNRKGITASGRLLHCRVSQAATLAASPT